MTADIVSLPCRDGFNLSGHCFGAGQQAGLGTVIVNPATGVLARYYHPFARYLAEAGFCVLTYDYRGIGQSRPRILKGSEIRWRDWGELDFEAAVRWALDHRPARPLVVVGHSIGGFLPGFAQNAAAVDRYLTVGAQYAFWRDYAAARRVRLLFKWHLAMPAITALFGYFPGRKLGWLEDLPAGVAHEWSFRRRQMEKSYPLAERARITERFAAVTAPILALGVTDDEFGTPEALERGLAYYQGSERLLHFLSPADLGFASLGHFDLFHSRHREGFWPSCLAWLKDGINPWPAARRIAAERPARLSQERL